MKGKAKRRVQSRTHNLRRVDASSDDFEAHTGVFFDDLCVKWDEVDTRLCVVTRTCSSDANEGGLELGSKRISGWMS